MSEKCDILSERYFTTERGFDMISRNVIIRQENLEPDYVVEIAKKCSSFNSTITMYAKNQAVNLKSIVNIFGTVLEKDEEVELVFSGNDEGLACEAILELFEH